MEAGYDKRCGKCGKQKSHRQWSRVQPSLNLNCQFESKSAWFLMKSGMFAVGAPFLSSP
jgi:hypothetical protein